MPRTALDRENEHDPFGEYDSDEGSDPEADDPATNEMDEDVSGSEISDEEDAAVDSDEEMEDGTSETSVSGDSDDESGDDAGQDNDRAQLRKIMNEEQGNVAATIAQASKADAEKGESVRRQRKIFDSVLNGRIRLQQGLVAVNSMQRSTNNDVRDCEQKTIRNAENAAITLWNTLEQLRHTIHESRTGTKRKHFDANLDLSTLQVWSHMKESDKENKSYRRSVLEKWSAKTQGATTQPASRRLTGASRQTTIVDVLDEQLSNKDRLVKRTRTPRSCAPVQANAGVTEATDIYDDADFYGLMLKELLEQRSIESASNVQVDTAVNQWQAVREAKTKKNVDTKASKGRKLRYTVHEKLQNFMAPEDRGSWTERQVDELFGGLLGKRLALGENEVNGGEGMDGNAEEDALMLFRN